MKSRIAIALLVAGTTLFAGCQSKPIKEIGEKLSDILQPQSEKDLAAGIRAYENGDYPTATKLLQSSLKAGLPKTADQVAAHKYLAFINCVSGRTPQCRDEFRQALDIDPNFDLDPAEAGHPIWGPVFRSVKSAKK